MAKVSITICPWISGDRNMQIANTDGKVTLNVAIAPKG